MRTLNYIILILLATLATTAFNACRDKNKSDESEQPHVIRSNDELKLSAQDTLAVLQQLKNSLSDLTNEINDGFDDITRFEQTLDSTDISQLQSSKRAKLRNDILLAKNDIQEKRRKLAELEHDLSNLDEQSKDEVEETINNLRQQLDLQKARVDQLSAKLHPSKPKPKAHNDISDSTSLANQPSDATQISLNEENNNNEQSEMLNNEVNECYYTIGSRNELKNHKIIDSEFLKKTKVIQSSNILASYFTKADKRTLNEITIPGKKVTVLTNHDLHSFSIEETGNITIIKILNPALFWEYSNYLVVETE